MHILFVTGEYPPQQGGVGAYTEVLGRALLAQGLQISVLTSASVDVNSAGIDGQIAVYPTIRRWNWYIWRAVWQWAMHLGVDWIHVQYQTAAYAMHPAINFAPSYWKRQESQQPIRIAWTYHDLLVPYLFPKAGGWLRRQVTEWPSRASDLTIVTNEGDRLQLAGKAPTLVKIPIGSNIQAQYISPQARTKRRLQRGYTDSDIILAYFGFLNRSKDGLTLIRTLARLCQQRPNVYLLMIGERVGTSDPTNYAYLQEVEASIAELGLQERVQWTGRQAGAEVSADLAICDVLLMPYEDGASLRRGTLMAGLAHGCAIVTTEPQSPLPELIHEHDLLYIPPGDANAATQAVLRIVDNSDFATNLRHHAQQRSLLFDWDAIAKQHMVHYNYSSD